MIIEKYVGILLCIFLYFTSCEQCYGREVDYLRPATSLLRENKDLEAQGNYNSNPLNNIVFNLIKFGAKGDGTTDDTEAFLKTWSEACKVSGGVMLVPTGYTFLLQPVHFDGSSCQPNIVVQVDGKIVAPANKKEWTKTDFQWILFRDNSKGITIKGNGVIDGNGESWWTSVKDDRPHAVRIVNSSNVIVTGIKIQNPPQMHIFIEEGQYLQIYSFTTSSPADSPNTDGIHISRFQHVEIHHSNLSFACMMSTSVTDGTIATCTGDDCVSIQKGCSDVRIHDVYCGPGHGFSIGGLGPSNTLAEVSSILVFNSTVQNSLNGVRIKTWPGGSGYVRDVTFSDIKMLDVATPIVIDQYYCGGDKNCPAGETNAVAVSNITYEKLTGTFTARSVLLHCSSYSPCKNLSVGSLNLIPSSSVAKKGHDDPECSNAYGKVLTDTTPPLNNCVLSNEKLS
ncbi:hypothetical protein OROHE_017577 [Orobanche hederae]